MNNVSKMNTEELRDAISAEDAMSTMEDGFLKIFYDLENDLIKAKSDMRYLDRALQTVMRTIKEINSAKEIELTDDAGNDID